MRSIVILISVASIVGAVAQQDVPRFKSGVAVVQFTVTVLDKNRHPVTGLTASDFDVLVDGKPQSLAAFAAVTLPDDPSLAAASIPPVAPDVHTNRLPLEGRLVVIVIDRSIPNGQPTQAARAIANAAIDRLGPNDLGAVLYTGAVSRKFSQGLSADRARLHASANLTAADAAHEPPGPPSLAAAIASGVAPQPNERLGRVQLASEEESGECPCGICVPDTLIALAKALAGGTARYKSILFVGSDIALASRGHGSTCESRIQSSRERLSRALDEANVTFNVIDPRGLEPLGESAEDGGPVGNIDRDANLFRQQSLAVLPDYTGGRVVLNNNKPETAIGPLFDESRAYYVLAIARDPAAFKNDGSHNIKVTVKRSDAIVNARNLHFAADPKAETHRAPNAAARALNELLPGGDFSLQMNLVPQFARDGSTEIHVLLGVDSALAGKLDVLIRAYDRVFTPVDTPLKQQLDVPPSAVAGSAAFQWASVLKSAPGDYEVRAAVATADGKHAANVIGYVDVPDVAKRGLALSGIVVKSGGGATVQRDFGAGAAIGLSFQVASAKKAMGAALVRYVLRNDLGQAVANIEVPHERATTIAPRVEGYEIGVRLPAPAGRYVATLEATDGHVTVQRQVLFTVR
jgi:VWFA-related protein